MTLGEVAPGARGRVSPGFEPVAAELARSLTAYGDAGAAFAAVVDGVPVVDVWGGVADGRRRYPWRQDTVVAIFSGTKGLVATCLLMLIERGALDLGDPVCTYWPQFAARGKEGVLIGHVVSHRAGLPGLLTPVTVREAADDRRMAELLAAQPALDAPGRRLVYHALTFGWLCGEVIRRVDGRSVGRFLQEEVARPLDLDAWIGLPAEDEDRVAALEPAPGFGAGQRAQAAGEPGSVAWSIFANPPRFASDGLAASTRGWRAAEVPASNGIASARSMARLYGCLARGGAIDGHRLMAPQTVELGRTCLARGVEPYLDEPMAFGVGFQLQTEAMPFGTPSDAFGHTGVGGSVHGAWPQLRTGFSYVTNTLREYAGPDPRAARLLSALHESVTR